MRLRDLDAIFLTFTRETVDPTIFIDGIKHTSGMRDTYHKCEDKRSGAHGIRFTCPKSKAEGKPHMVILWFADSPVPPNVGVDSDGNTVRWQASGTNLDDLTLKPSIWEKDDKYCGWHGFVTAGDAT
jgi:hypothetical protein